MMRRRHQQARREKSRPRGDWKPWQVAHARNLLNEGWTAERFAVWQAAQPVEVTL